jgi:cell division protein FtsL
MGSESATKGSVGRRNKIIPRNLKAGPVTLTIVVITLVCLLSLLFLAQIFQSSTKGYEITDLERKVSELKEQNKALEIKAAELRSFENIKSEAEKLNMVRADKIVYVKQSGRSVAVANR